MRIEGLIGREVADLGDLPRDVLTSLWQRDNGCPPPSGVRRDLLIRSAAWHLQAKHLGGFDAECRRLLKAAVQAASTGLGRKAGASIGSAQATDELRGDEKAAPTSRRRGRKIGPGARLIRDWNGKTHAVDVIDVGFVFEGKLYASLTAIAEHITGAHWSGPGSSAYEQGRGKKTPLRDLHAQIERGGARSSLQLA